MHADESLQEGDNLLVPFLPTAGARPTLLVDWPKSLVSRAVFRSYTSSGRHARMHSCLGRVWTAALQPLLPLLLFIEVFEVMVPYLLCLFLCGLWAEALSLQVESVESASVAARSTLSVVQGEGPVGLVQGPGHWCLEAFLCRFGHTFPSTDQASHNWPGVGFP